jgi:hypothetical protein
MSQIELMKYIPRAKTATTTAKRRRKAAAKVAATATATATAKPTAHDVDAATEQLEFWPVADELIHDWKYEC